MLEPIQQPNWLRPDRRAWGLSLSLLLFAIGFSISAFFWGRSWTYQIGLEYLPKELTIKAYNIDSDLMEFALGLPNYAVGAFYSIIQILPEAWIYSLLLAGFLLAFSLLSAGTSYLESSFQYGAIALFALGIAIFGLEIFKPLGFSQNWITAVALLLITAPIYIIGQWLSHWNLARRWWVFLFYYGLLSYLLIYQNGSTADFSLITAQLWLPLLIVSLIFMAINATDVLQAVLTLVTREENSKHSWMHFSIFSLLYLSNFILIYLRNTGTFIIDIFYLNPFVLQLCSILVGLWMLSKKSELVSDQKERDKGYSTIYISLSVITILTAGMGFGLANDLMIEVLEDAICLIHFCFGASFFLYVVINYFQLMGLGLRVHLVIFKPRYMPVYGIPVFGLLGVFIFLLNSTYFPYYQSLSAKEVLLSDHAQYAADPFMAENYLQKALLFDSRNQRTNLSLAGLYYKNGNAAKAQEFAQASMDKFPSTEAYLTISQIYRQKNMPIYELLALQESLRKFPTDGKLLNNMGMAFNETKWKDSAEFYLSEAAQKTETESVGNANLGFYYLVNKLETEGLPKKTPGNFRKDNWSQLNNSIVFANVAHEKSPAIGDLPQYFDKVPESLQAYLLFHAYINKAITKDSIGFAALEKLESDTLRKFHSEPFHLAKAMVKYRTGQTQLGIESLLGLYQSRPSSRLEVTLLLGQIFYEQGAFSMAARFFKEASDMGMNKARYWYALSYLDAGKQAAASSAFQESLPFLGPANRIRITVLMDGLKSGPFNNAAHRSDPEKSAYVKVNWNSLNESQLTDLIYLTSDKEAQRFLWLYAFQRAYRESMTQRTRSLYQFGFQFFRKNKKWQDLLAEAKPKYLEISENTAGLEKWIAAQPESDFIPFYQGRLAQLKKKSDEAIRYFKIALPANPLHTRQAGLAIGYLSKFSETRSYAYQKALEVSDLNPTNVAYLKLYAQLAVKEGVPDFAYQMIPKIEMQSSKAEAMAFKKSLDDEVALKYGHPTEELPKNNQK